MMRALRHSSGAHGSTERECPSLQLACPSGILSSRASPKRQWKLVVLLSMFEPAWYVQQTVENAISRTRESTLILLHLNADTSYSRALYQWLANQPRVELSCFRHHVEAYTGSVLLSQLSSLQWARCRGLLRGTSHVVLQASNMWWWREGMEAAVEARGSSTPRITSSAECTEYDLVKARRKDGTHQKCFPEDHRDLCRLRTVCHLRC